MKTMGTPIIGKSRLGQPKLSLNSKLVNSGENLSQNESNYELMSQKSMRSHISLSSSKVSTGKMSSSKDPYGRGGKVILEPVSMTSLSSHKKPPLKGRMVE